LYFWFNFTALANVHFFFLLILSYLLYYRKPQALNSPLKSTLPESRLCWTPITLMATVWVRPSMTGTHLHLFGLPKCYAKPLFTILGIWVVWPRTSSASARLLCKRKVRQKYLVSPAPFSPLILFVI